MNQGRDRSAHAETADVPTGAFCKCGAWRGCLGLEPTPELFTKHMVMVFREVRRVLRKDGTCWVNLGDTYATGAGAVGECPGGGTQGAAWRGDGRPAENGRGEPQGHRGNREGAAGKHEYAGIGPMTQPNRMPIPGLKPKDLCGIPWMVAFALRADGWWLRQDIVWAKPNPMPESIRDRCTKSHEYIFLLTRSERYYWDFDAMQEQVNGGAHPRMPGNVSHKHQTEYEENGDERHRTKAGLVAYSQRQRAKWKTPDGWDTTKGEGGHGSFHKNGREKGRKPGVTPKSAEAGSGIKANESFHAAVTDLVSTRNKRSVWTVTTEPYKEAHFATMPTALVKPCILAGTKPGDVVLDPFLGSGTVAMVALELGRKAIGIEMNPAYAAMAERRCDVTPGLNL